MEENQKKYADVIEKIDNKDFSFYFFVLDTKGNPTAGIANIYEHVKVLNDIGYKAAILHEKNDYHGVGEWLGSEYTELPHVSIETQELNITPQDFIVIPEIFSNIMNQVKQFPCKKVVFSQSYHYILDLLNIGVRWSDYGFNHVITTSDKQADYIKTIMPMVKTKVIPVSIPDYFKPTSKIKKPIIALHTRDQGEALKIVKSFYLQYPIYKWVTFKELRGMPRRSFAKSLGESCLSVWVDDVSGFGTFPIESIECDTPVIGKIPNLIPEWMSDTDENGNVSIKRNGVWVSNTLDIPELISQYIKVWLEDAVPQDLLDAMTETKGNYTSDAQVEKITEVYSDLINERKEELTVLMNKELESN